MTIALMLSAMCAALPVSVLSAPGDLYVSNLATNTVEVYSPDGAKSVFASGLSSPQGLAFDHAHNLYVADGGSGSIFKYDTAGTRTTFYTGLSSPVGLTINGNRLLVVESGREQALALVLDQSGTPRTVFSGRESMVDVKEAGLGTRKSNSTGSLLAGRSFSTLTRERWLSCRARKATVYMMPM